jgi:hypothetical protein
LLKEQTPLGKLEKHECNSHSHKLRTCPAE